ncbi:hypothetical protein [Serratia symbiotica]|uniref:hypothetical protein n=1 Tax=Serratia symbiotica TaxID=138074 RepID=UPI001E54DFDE|nr:hypothetical protein [Serratia symbiotica]
MQINQWTTKDGSTSSGYQMVADSVIRVRAVRPAGRKGRWGQASDAPQRAREQPQPVLGGWDVYQKPDDMDQTPPYDEPF